jgi:MFS family permease
MPKDNQVRKFYLITFFQHLYFILPVWVLYGLEVLNLSNTWALSLGLIGTVSSTLFEVPTGYIGDRFGRKVSFVSGAFIFGFSMALFTTTSHLPLLIFIQVSSGVGLALCSGSLDALMYEYLANKDQKSQYESIAANQYSTLFAGRIIASIAGGIMYGINPRLPYILLAGSAILAGIVAATLIEGEKKNTGDSSHGNKNIFKTLFQNLGKPTILSITIFAGLDSFAGNGIFFSYQPYFQSLSLGTESIGLIFAGISVLSLMGSQLSKPLVKKFRARYILTSITLVTTLLSLFLALGNWVLVIIGIIAFSICSGLAEPAQLSFTQKNIDDDSRNTVLSTVSFVNSTAVLLSGFIAGLILDTSNFNTLYSFTGILALSSSIVFGFIFWRQIEGEKRREKITT